jgi:hypothetical protein
MDEEIASEMIQVYHHYVRLICKFVGPNITHLRGRGRGPEVDEQVLYWLSYEFDISVHAADRLNWSQRVELMALLDCYFNQPSERQTALVQAENRRKELEAVLASPETPAAHRPGWRALRKALNRFPAPASRNEAIDDPYRDWIKATQVAILAAYGEHKRGRPYSRKYKDLITGLIEADDLQREDVKDKVYEKWWKFTNQATHHAVAQFIKDEIDRNSELAGSAFP